MSMLRSLLFVPGDSQRKQAKVLSLGADAVIIDLEDSVTADKKAEARLITRDFMADAIARREAGEVLPQLFLRVNSLDGDLTCDDLDMVMGTGVLPDAIMLPKSTGPEDVRTIDALLLPYEKRAGAPLQSVKILPIVTETPTAAMTIHRYLSEDYAGRERLIGLSWGAEDLSAAIGATQKRDANGKWAFAYQMVRAQTLLAAHALGIAAIDTLHADFRDEDGLRAAATQARADGFQAMLAIHPAQVSVINSAFTPSQEERTYAQAVIDAFAANPGAGTISLNGKMLDRPHLELAKRVLQQP